MIIFVGYHTCDVPLETVSTQKHLGVVLSANLEWRPDVDEVSKTKRLLGFIRRTVGANNPVTVRKLFVALVNKLLSIVRLFGVHMGKLDGVQKSFTYYFRNMFAVACLSCLCGKYDVK